MAADASRVDFSRLARTYEPLERLAFGRDLEWARTRFLDQLARARRILVLGEGDGRCVARVARETDASIHCVDVSPGMIARASARVASFGMADRVRFECVDAATAMFERDHYDAVITFFFLDCFSTETATQIIGRVRPSLRPGGRWLFSDFVIPDAGWSRLRARAMVSGLYAFFRRATRIEAHELPPSETLLVQAGLRPLLSDTRRGLIRAAVFGAD